ncbi:kti12, chromatin associated [Coemansia sp. RSA 989]|nr:chromatin associated protein KTI12 [Coemansia mojavensis]KAJ1742321.1 kti12, chromatin associated [Coemansia sp. RSA 1086]KAJ1751691.1 kti12, chromatin associated [Coemansia sp. RSA 1821]KAJ1866399.1 kti12, chromatin associated [Coemansia sp. RSA 989]KAJ1872958.1 kti12, chromatin associated [Coemansia sp. RSA 990]KAJ2629582.1 kti12, chromatin associated [Coemansia sp. RSA 1290]
MPLVMMTGFPSSGKSTRALELKRLFEERLARPENQHRKISVQIVSDETLGVDHSAYAKASDEKMARSSLMSTIERILSPDCIVIADTPNYIKGLRYQLYCIARELQSTHCVLYCALPVEEARRINNARGDQAYSPELFEDMVMRYEEPNSAARWDRPLFTVIQNDPNDKLPMDSIWDALVERRAPPPTFATAPKPVAETNYLFELDQKTLEIITALMDAQNSGVPMSHVVVPGTTEKVEMPGRTLSLSELRRQRIQFTKLNRQAPLQIDKIAELFVKYLNINL